jgi:hypothetical protein
MQCLLTVKGKSMTYSNSVSGIDNVDDLLDPAAVTVCDTSSPILPRPVSLLPDIADSGRISFGASMRLPSSK